MLQCGGQKTVGHEWTSRYDKQSCVPYGRKDREVNIPFGHVDTGMRCVRHHVNYDPQAVISNRLLDFSDLLRDRLDIEHLSQDVGTVCQCYETRFCAYEVVQLLGIIGHCVGVYRPRRRGGRPNVYGKVWTTKCSKRCPGANVSCRKESTIDVDHCPTTGEGRE